MDSIFAIVSDLKKEQEKDFFNTQKINLLSRRKNSFLEEMFHHLVMSSF